MRKPVKVVLFATAAAILLALGAYVAVEYFLPERSVGVNEGPPAGDVTVLKVGSFRGATGHTVEGTVKLLRVGNAHYLRFENYTQTQGPDVFVFLTREGHAGSTEDVTSGLKVPLEGGPDGGEIVKEGNFNQRLPADFDPSRYGGVAIWCEQYAVLFGNAALTPP